MTTTTPVLTIDIEATEEPISTVSGARAGLALDPDNDRVYLWCVVGAGEPEPVFHRRHPNVYVDPEHSQRHLAEWCDANRDRLAAWGRAGADERLTDAISQWIDDFVPRYRDAAEWVDGDSWGVVRAAMEYGSIANAADAERAEGERQGWLFTVEAAREAIVNAIETHLSDLLTEDRIPWRLIVEAGCDLEAIAQEAGEAGDDVLLRRVKGAIARYRGVPSAASDLYYVTFCVEGIYQFPIDMLRYDSCFPTTESKGSYEIVRSVRGEDPAFPVDGTTSRYRIELGRHAERKDWMPTIGRWERFGWKVDRNSILAREV